MCPASGVTGGPEALHQLCDKINNNGGKAKMIYVDYGSEEVIAATPPARYRYYKIRTALAIIDDEKHVIVVPEIWPHILYRFNRIQKCIWWLSVNYGKEKAANLFRDSSILHLYQSVYAAHFLKGASALNVAPLYDYLSLSGANKQILKSEPIVLYNPKKGIEITNRLIELCKNDGIHFIPLKGFTRPELVRMMKRSKVYIDFGDHPGKDRIPREAALYNNIIITGIKGAAGYYDDLPIPDEFKYEETRLDAAREGILRAISDHNRLSAGFDYYRRVIRSQETEFTMQAIRLFCFSYAMADGVRLRYARKFYFDKAEEWGNRIKRAMPASLKIKVRRFVP